MSIDISSKTIEWSKKSIEDNVHETSLIPSTFSRQKLYLHLIVYEPETELNVQVDKVDKLEWKIQHISFIMLFTLYQTLFLSFSSQASAALSTISLLHSSKICKAFALLIFIKLTLIFIFYRDWAYVLFLYEWNLMLLRVFFRSEIRTSVSWVESWDFFLFIISLKDVYFLFFNDKLDNLLSFVPITKDLFFYRHGCKFSLESFSSSWEDLQSEKISGCLILSRRCIAWTLNSCTDLSRAEISWLMVI